MRSTPDIGVLKHAIQLACRAPSVHNSQPWLWVAEAGSLRLLVNPHRMVPGTDNSSREAIISCGAVLDHLRVAMLAAGWRSNVKRFPIRSDPNVLASVEFFRVEHVTDAERERAGAILQRRTDRLPLGQPTYWELFEPRLRGVIDSAAVKLQVLPDDARPRLAEATRLTEEFRRDDWLYHAELDWWTSPFMLDDGLPATALTSDNEQHRVGVGREFPTRIHANRRREVELDWSKILALSTAHDNRIDWLRCGEVLSATLLECTLAGIATCTLTHLTEVNESREILRGLIGADLHPQVLVRAGIAPLLENVGAPTPRRPLHDVLHVR